MLTLNYPNHEGALPALGTALAPATLCGAHAVRRRLRQGSPIAMHCTSNTIVLLWGTDGKT